MNNLKFAIAFTSVALMMVTFAAAAPAATLTSGGSTYTGSISSEAEGHVVLDNPIAKIECASSMGTGGVTSHGAGVTITLPLVVFSFSNCTNSWHVTVVAAGIVQHHFLSWRTSTVTSSGWTIEATRFGITCRYATSDTDIGTNTFGLPSRLHVNGALPFHSGSGLCGSGATTMTGSYKITSPAELDIDA